MNASPTLAIVLHWTRPDLTRRAVAALEASEPRPDILVVDNSASEPAAERPADFIQGAGHLALPRNVGFAAGMNEGIRWALDRDYHFVWLVNDDAVVEPEAHRHLVAAASQQPLSVWSPRLVDEDGRDAHVGGSFVLDGTDPQYADAAGFTALRAAGRWLTGTALFMTARAVRKVGLLDEAFFAYWEDVDWSVRALGADVTLGVVAEAVVVHRQGEVVADRARGRHFLIARNEFVFARKHLERQAWDRVLPRIAARQLRLAGWFERHDQQALARAVVAGGLSGLRGRTGPPRHAWVRESLASELLSHSLSYAHRLERTAQPRVTPLGQVPSPASAGPASDQDVAS